MTNKTGSPAWGHPCKHHGYSERYKNGTCKECKRIQNARRVTNTSYNKRYWRGRDSRNKRIEKL